MPIPIVLDTDIGTDVDDAYALVLAATAPELDLRAVTVVNNDVDVRARIARRILYLLSHNAHVARGESLSLDGSRPPGWGGYEGKGVDLGPSVEGAYDPAFVEMADQILSQGCDTIVAIGQLTNVALAIRKIPPASRTEVQVFAMASSFQGFGWEVAEREHNTACDPLALKEVLESGVAVKLIGLNVTRRTAMMRGHVQRLQGFKTPISRDLAAMHRGWFGAIRGDQSPMHDPLTVAAVFRPDLVSFIAARAEVDLASGVAAFFDDGEPNCEVAAEIDADGFHEMFFDRVFNSIV